MWEDKEDLLILMVGMLVVATSTVVVVMATEVVVEGAPIFDLALRVLVMS